MTADGAELGLVIFDCDGVLVDSESISNGVLAEKIAREGLVMGLERARREFQGLLLGEVLARVQERLGRTLPDGWLADYERERAEVFRRELQAVPGAAHAVRAVREGGLRVCVASQGKLSKTRLSLELAGLRDLFAEHELFSAENVARGKPHPDLFLHAADTMGVEAGRCVVVEDTHTGVTAALAAGMRVLGYAADADEHALRDAGAEVFHELTELPARIGL